MNNLKYHTDDAEVFLYYHFNTKTFGSNDHFYRLNKILSIYLKGNNHDSKTK